MKEIKLQIDGTEITAQVSEDELAKLMKPERARTRTGYERVENERMYYVTAVDGNYSSCTENGYADDSSIFTSGNYINDEALAKDRARAMRLHWQLEQWQALNDEPVDWGNHKKSNFKIRFDQLHNRIDRVTANFLRDEGVVYFSTQEKAEEAIGVFRDELTWYFTEYRSRLGEKRTEAE